MMPFYEVPEAKEVVQSTYFWTGTPAELALVLQRELGVTEDVVPSTARYMQLTEFSDENARATAHFSTGIEIHALVTFYTENMATIECDAKDEQIVHNFVL